MDQITPDLIIRLKKDIEFLKHFDNSAVASIADRVEILLESYLYQKRAKID